VNAKESLFLHVAYGGKKERKTPTNQKGPGFITRKCAVHPRLEKSHSGKAPTVYKSKSVVLNFCNQLSIAWGANTKNLGYLQSIVCLVGCGLVSRDASLFAEFLDLNNGHQVVGANSWIHQSTCCSINTLVACFLEAIGEKMFALESDFHATPLEVIKCGTRFVSIWLIHALVKPNLHVDSAMLEEGGVVLRCLVQMCEWMIGGSQFSCQHSGKCVILIFS